MVYLISEDKNNMDNEVLKQEFAAVSGDIKQGFAEQDARMDKKFAEQDVRIEKRFDDQNAKTDKKLAEQEEKIPGKIREEIVDLMENSIAPQFDELRSGITKIRSEMVTKDYLDNKLADLEGGTISRLRKEDNKIDKLLKILEAKSILSSDEARSFDEFKVFPRLPAA